MKNFLFSLIVLASTSGCAGTILNEPRSLGEINSSYSYIPLDPLPVTINPDACRQSLSSQATVLDSLPDNAVRISIREISGTGGVTLGPAAVGTKGNTYQITLDYINADTSNVRFNVSIFTENDDPIPITNQVLPDGELIVTRKYDNQNSVMDDVGETGDVVIPVYVGVGLRLTATVQVLEGNVNLSSLGALAASVQAKRSAGSLVVQTLGINGKQVAASLPLPSELNATTIQNAIQSLGAIKAIMYDPENTRIVPRVTGIYNPLPSDDPRLVNLIVSELAERPIFWEPPCVGAGSVAGAN